jgi:hypothetical protein
MGSSERKELDGEISMGELAARPVRAARREGMKEAFMTASVFG